MCYVYNVQLCFDVVTDRKKKEGKKNEKKNCVRMMDTKKKKEKL